MSSTFRRIRGAALLSLAAITLPMYGQAGAAAPAGAVSDEAPYSQELDQSRDLLTHGDQNGALDALFASNTNRRNTAGWSIESGVKLLHLATSCSNRSDYAQARAVATLAVQMFTTAEAQYVTDGNQTGAARAQELIGMVEETVLHDDNAALTAYTRALGHNPKSAAGINGSNRLNHTKG